MYIMCVWWGVYAGVKTRRAHKALADSSARLPPPLPPPLHSYCSAVGLRCYSQKVTVEEVSTHS